MQWRTGRLKFGCGPPRFRVKAYRPFFERLRTTQNCEVALIGSLALIIEYFSLASGSSYRLRAENNQLPLRELRVNEVRSNARSTLSRLVVPRKAVLLELSSFDETVMANIP